jgi:PAS domain S-box-containing protein
LDLVAGTAEWSEEGCRLLGFAPGEVPAQDDFMGTVHVEDRTRVRDGLALAIRDGTPMDLEVRVMSSDGEVRWVHMHGRTARDSAGRPVR